MDWSRAGLWTGFHIRVRARGNDLPLVEPAIQQRGTLACGLQQNVLSTSEARSLGQVDEDRVENLLERPCDGRKHSQAPVFDFSLAEGHKGLVSAEVKRVEACDVAAGQDDNNIGRRVGWRHPVTEAGEVLSTP